MNLPRDPFFRPMLVPSAFDRQHRVLLVGQAFAAWFEGRQPSDVARLFTAGGALNYLNGGSGDLLTDYWRIRGRQGSTATPPVLWKALQEERQDDGERED